MKIFIIGFMGSGKSYWGKIWAAKCSFKFFDLDVVIEHQEQKTTGAIFEKYGEGYFREKESAVLRTFSEYDDCIIACGGGTPCYNDNLQWMNENGVTVYLKAGPDRILERIEDEKENRPLISKLNKAEIFFFIEQKLKEREPFYSRAEIILPIEELSSESIKGIINS